MSKEALDSDRVNYLIWRYLLESDYRETATRLQKEWNLENPQQLPFAPHVTNHALVSVLNKGLLYNACERDSARTTRDVVGPVSGFFGPLMHPRPAIDEDDFENVRKRQMDDDQHQNQNGPSGKRLRLSNGYENGFDSTPKPAMEMDIDDEQNGDGNAYPSPEQVPSPAVVTTGPETGTQIEKVTELGSETTFLDISDDSSARNAVLLQCDFNPQDPMILAVAGTDALARMWTLSRGSTAADLNSNDMDTDQPSSQQPPYLSLLDEGSPSATNVTSLSWTSDGKLIAVASEPTDDNTAKVDIWTLEGTPISSFSGLEASVVSLQWNPANTLLLVLSPILITGGVLITVWVPTTQESRQYSLPGVNGTEQDLVAVWISNEEFVLCGGDMLQAFHCREGVISPLRKYETREGHALSKVAFDFHSQLLATASDTGMIDIWDQQGHGRSFNAHQGLITALVWQPYQGSTPLGDDAERLVASAGEDHAISIWNARSPAKSKSSMTMGSAVVGLAFTPDGAFIAGATFEKIWIWKVDDVHVPRATWVRGSETGWQTPRSHDSATEEMNDQHCLCWDADGQKLAYGVNTGRDQFSAVIRESVPDAEIQCRNIESDIEDFEKMSEMKIRQRNGENNHRYKVGDGL